MNKVINIFSGVVLAIYCGIVMALVYDLSFSSLVNLKAMPFKVEICGAFAVLIFLLGLLRIKRKWQGANDMRNFKNFSFVRHISRSALNLSLLYTIAEAIFMGFFLYFLYRIGELSMEYILPMIAVIIFLLAETLFFAIRILKAGDGFRVGINKKAVAFFNREMHIFYFVGLTRIELHQDMINFQYKEDLNLLMPLEILDSEDRIAFREALIFTLEENFKEKNGKSIYIDDAFRTLK